MLSALNQIKFFILCTGSLLEGVIRHVTSVGNIAGDHEKRLMNHSHAIINVPVHQIHQAALCIEESGIGMSMSAEIIEEAVSVKCERKLLGLFVSDVHSAD